MATHATSSATTSVLDPATWAVDSYPGHDDRIRYLVQAGGHPVCSGIDSFIDARRIAAVPQLLEACQFTLQLLDDLSTGQFAIGGDRPARLKLASAVARARGQAA